MDSLQHVQHLFRRDPGRLRVVLSAIRETVCASLVVDQMKNATRRELNDRISICAKWFMVMYKDLKWATTRCLDELPKALRAELDKVEYTPAREGRNTWGVTGPQDLIYLPG